MFFCKADYSYLIFHATLKDKYCSRVETLASNSFWESHTHTQANRKGFLQKSLPLWHIQWQATEKSKRLLVLFSSHLKCQCFSKQRISGSYVFQRAYMLHNTQKADTYHKLFRMFSLNKPACPFIRGERYDPCYQIYDCQQWLATSKLIRSINHLTMWNLRLIRFSSFSKQKRYMMIRDDSLLKSAGFLSPLSC